MSTVFSGMSAYVGIDERGKARIDLHLTGLGETRILKGLVVSRNLFDVLGVAPLLGRSFTGEDHVAILTLHHDRKSCRKVSGASDDTAGAIPRC